MNIQHLLTVNYPLTDARDLADLNHYYLTLARQLGRADPLRAETELGLTAAAIWRLADLPLPRVQTLAEQMGVLVFQVEFGAAFWEARADQATACSPHEVGRADRDRIELIYQYLVKGRELSRADPFQAEVWLGIDADTARRLIDLSLPQLWERAGRPGAVLLRARFDDLFWQAASAAAADDADAMTALRLRAAVLAAAGAA